MAAPDMEVIKEIPGYKVILKAVLKAQIQQLVEQLAEYTSEDSIILTASIHDGTLSHLGSDSGKSFLDDHEDVKSQFLGFCLKYHHKKKQEQEQKEREEAMRKAAAAAAVAANTYSPRHYMPTRSPRHPSPRFMGARHPLRSPNQRHQPYPITRPIRAAAMPVSSPSPLKSPNKLDGQIIKIEPEDSNDESSNQDSAALESDINAQSSSQSPSNAPSTPSKVKSESGEKDDDAKSESSNSTIPNEPPAEGLSLDSDLSNLISGNNQEQSSETASEMDPNVSVKLEALTENEMELEITGVEPGRPMVPQDNWDPNVSMGMNYDPTGATGNPGDMTAQGYRPGRPSWYILQTVKENDTDSVSLQLPSGATLEGEICTICNKVFPHNYHLRRHMKSHLQQRDFCCTVCDSQFLLKHHLKNHLRNKHGLLNPII